MAAFSEKSGQDQRRCNQKILSDILFHTPVPLEVNTDTEFRGPRQRIVGSRRIVDLRITLDEVGKHPEIVRSKADGQAVDAETLAKSLPVKLVSEVFD